MKINTNFTNWLRKTLATLIVMVMAISTLNLSVNAASGTLPLAETIDLRTEVGRVAMIYCTIGYKYLYNPSTTDHLQPSAGRHYGEGDMGCGYTYTDPVNDFYIKAGKAHSHDMSNSSDATETISNIDNSGGTAADYGIDSSGNDNTEEEFGYSVGTLGIPLSALGHITVQDDGNFSFTAQTCGSGTDDCFFDISDTMDTVLIGDNSTGEAICTDNTSCYISYQFAANITNSTVPGAYGEDDPGTTGTDETYEFMTEITITP
ncbi:hypothetical protein KKD70_05360 [Patescibacteria group bacterium]|nr:hypothetical protein [Patescibacteria group bacterium]